MSDKAGFKQSRMVRDRQGATYQLTEKLAEGGQGIVCKTEYPNVLVKISHRPAGDSKASAWYQQIQWVSRLDLDGLNIARPQTLIVDPRPGYVMELMEGLIPLQGLVDESFEAMMDGAGLVGFINSGGLSRRLRILSSLATTLAKLHGRGLAYGDLSPSNVFVSRSIEHSEVWLIDCDNLSLFCRDGLNNVYTPDYGAPEVVKGEQGIDSLSDSWSFAVIAFQLLTLQHPFKGDLVNEGEPEIEESALGGGLPWIDHPSDDSNRSSHGLPREFMLTKRLRALFEQCFNAGRDLKENRPTLSDWREAFDEAVMALLYCEEEDGCQSSFYVNNDFQCPFCDRIKAKETAVVLTHFLFSYTSDEELRALPEYSPWLRTGHVQLVSKQPVELKNSPIGTAAYWESDRICELKLSDDGLHITSEDDRSVFIQRPSDNKLLPIKGTKRLANTLRQDELYVIHLGDPAETHYCWRFRW
jgi:DNA-binding helix-hairpin-helix protein with protein kinase domain